MGGFPLEHARNCREGQNTFRGENVLLNTGNGPLFGGRQHPSERMKWWAIKDLNL
jgi:hypothetical protein